MSRLAVFGMKFAAHTFGFYFMASLCGAMVLLDLVWALTFGFSSYFVFVRVQLACFFPFLLMLTIGRSMMMVVTIDGFGVTASSLHRTFGFLSWNEMGEVGIGTQSSSQKVYYWIYFVREPLTNEQRNGILSIGQTDDGIRVEFSQKVIEAVQQFYKGDIKYLGFLSGVEN